MTIMEKSAVRSLVLNGLRVTAVIPRDSTKDGNSGQDGEFYHELEIYNKLMRGDPDTDEVASPTISRGRSRVRARTPPAVPVARQCDIASEDRRSKTLDGVSNTSPKRIVTHKPFVTQSRNAKYMGSFPVTGRNQTARAEYVSSQLYKMKESGKCIPVLVVVNLAGVKICRPEDKSVSMAHALRRISYATCEPTKFLFGFVAREPKGSPSRQYCHAFTTETAEEAEELNTLLGNAFRMAFATQIQHSPISHWKKDLNSNGGDRNMGIRAPNSIPGLPHHYPHASTNGFPNRSPCKVSEAAVSPCGSEESNSPTELNCYRRLGDKPPLMKRLALGLSGALVLQQTEDSTPLVLDSPISPLNRSVIQNGGGYVNEAVSDSDSKACSGSPSSTPSAPPPSATPTLQFKHLQIDHVNIDSDDKNAIIDDFKKGKYCINNIDTSSRAPSSSSGGSSCGEAPRPLPLEEAELRLAPWFQAGIPREIALEVLAHQPIGSFMVRSSTTKSGCFALSLRVPRDFQPTGIAHYLIIRTNKGYKIKGFTKEFRTLTALITHHSVMPELLPVALTLARPTHRNHNPAYSRTHIHDEDPDYTALADFRKMMADLNL